MEQPARSRKSRGRNRGKVGTRMRRNEERGKAE